jgi:hypothetical protein
MASGHVNRTIRPNTWLHRPALHVKKTLANPEPSTHGTSEKVRACSVNVRLRAQAHLVRSSWHVAEVPIAALTGLAYAGSNRGRDLARITQSSLLRYLLKAHAPLPGLFDRVKLSCDPSAR